MRLRMAWAVLLAFMLTAAQAEAQDAQQAGQGTDVQAEVVLKAACAGLSALRSYSFTAEIDKDYAYPTGDTVRISQTLTAKVERPGKFRCDVRGDDRDMSYVLDGKTLTVLDLDKGVYGKMEAKGDIDATVREVEERYGLEAPMANFLFNEPCASMDLSSVTGRYLGIHTAAGKDCHHLIYFGKDMNWQIWIGEADGLPYKLVITDKSLSGWPQYTAVITKWNTQATFKPGTFVFKAPKDTSEIPVLPVSKGQDQDGDDEQGGGS